MFHAEAFSKHESRIIATMGLFYKTDKPNSVLEEVYSIFSDAIKINTRQKFTPVQASAYTEIQTCHNFSFSAPTSAGKSFLFRELIKESSGDIVIVVPSRALIAEYYYETIRIVDNSVLVLQFIEDLNKEKTNRRIFIITPERGTELFKYSGVFDIELILLDEAQISEEHIRGMTFDSFVRRADRAFPKAKKVFAHPFICNPEAQLIKHGFFSCSSHRNYDYHAVGKLFISYNNGVFEYFSPNVTCKSIPLGEDIACDIHAADRRAGCSH